MREITLLFSEVAELLEAKTRLELIEDVWNSDMKQYQKEDVMDILCRKDGDIE